MAPRQSVQESRWVAAISFIYYLASEITSIIVYLLSQPYAVWEGTAQRFEDHGSESIGVRCTQDLGTNCSLCLECSTLYSPHLLRFHFFGEAFHIIPPSFYPLHFFFFLNVAIPGIWKFPGQGLNLSNACANPRSFNPLHQAWDSACSSAVT